MTNDTCVRRASPAPYHGTLCLVIHGNLSKYALLSDAATASA